MKVLMQSKRDMEATINGKNTKSNHGLFEDTTKASA
jgi:hypothetical protein